MEVKDERWMQDEEEIISEVTPKAQTSRGAWASLVLGIIGSLAWLVPLVGMPITIVGTVFGAMNFKSKKAKGAAIGGFVVNVVFLAAAIAKGIVDLVKFCRKK